MNNRMDWLDPGTGYIGWGKWSINCLKPIFPKRGYGGGRVCYMRGSKTYKEA